MSQDNPPRRDPSAYNPQHELLYDPLLEDIVVNKWQFRVILEEIERAKVKTKFEDSFPWLGVFLAFLLPQLNSDFKTFVFPAPVWQALDAMAAALSGYQTSRVWWTVLRHRKDTTKTSSQFVQELVDDMKARREEFKNQELAKLPVTPSPTTPSALISNPPTSPTPRPNE